MFRIFGLLAAALACAGAVTVSGEMSFDREGLVFSEVEGMTVVSLLDCSPTWEVGAPCLPIAVAHLVVPQGMKVTGIRLGGFETEVIEGEFALFPVQEPRPISDQSPVEFARPNPEYYGDFEYPVEIVTAGHQGSMFGYNVASIFVAPVQYTAKEKRLVFHPKVSFTLELEPAELDVVPVVHRSEKARQRIEEDLASFVLNPEDLSGYAPGK